MDVPRLCRTCRVFKPLDQFDKSGPTTRRHSCKTCRAAYYRDWRVPKRDAHLKHMRDYYWENRQRLIAANEITRRDPVRRAAAVKRAEAWAKANPERNRVHRQNIKQNRRGRGERKGVLSAALVPLLMTEQNSRCPYCLADLQETGYHLDHHMPLSLGGAHEDDNMQLTCPPCNLRKGDRDPVEFAASMLASAR